MEHLVPFIGILAALFCFLVAYVARKTIDFFMEIPTTTENNIWDGEP